MQELLLPPGIKGLNADSVFFSINNFNQKSFFKTIFEELKQSFLLNVYINVSDLLFVFAVHKLCRTAENSILHFVVGISHICCIIYKYVNTCSITYYLQQYNLTSFEPSIGLTPCCINQVTTHERDRQRELQIVQVLKLEKRQKTLQWKPDDLFYVILQVVSIPMKIDFSMMFTLPLMLI